MTSVSLLSGLVFLQGEGWLGRYSPMSVPERDGGVGGEGTLEEQANICTHPECIPMPNQGTHIQKNLFKETVNCTYSGEVVHITEN